MKSRSLKNIIHSLFFGILTGFIMTYALSIFIPEFYTDWAAGFVCSGRVEYLTFKQAYYCFTAPNVSFDINNLMFHAVFRRIIFVVMPICILFSFGFTWFAEFLYKRREAAGF